MKLRLSLHLACHNRIWNVSIYGNDKGTARSSRKFELGPLSYQPPNSSQIGVYPAISLFWKQPNCKVAQSRSHCIGSILVHQLYPHYRFPDSLKKYHNEPVEPEVKSIVAGPNFLLSLDKLFKTQIAAGEIYYSLNRINKRNSSCSH